MIALLVVEWDDDLELRKMTFEIANFTELFVTTAYLMTRTVRRLLIGCTVKCVTAQCR